MSDNESTSENEAIRPQSTDSIDGDTAPVETLTVDNDANNESQAEEDKKDDQSKKPVVIKTRRRQVNPAPKFDVLTIRNKRGLPALINYFKDKKFKKHGYEEHDLNLLMSTYQYWCHRFYPKLTFDDCIARFEWLGNKRGTQIYLKKLRMGIEDVDVAETVKEDDNIPTEGFVEPFDDQFDQLLATNVTEQKVELTEEQIERINQNRLRAEALRRERLSRNVGDLSQTSFASLSQDQDNLHNDTEMDVDHDQELSLDNILDIINDDNVSTTSNHLTNNKESQYDKKISGAIRKNTIPSDSENEESDDMSSSVSQKRRLKSDSEPDLSQRVNTQQNNATPHSNEESESDKSTGNSSDESVELRLSLLKNKKYKPFKKMTVSESDDDSNDLKTPVSIQKKKNNTSGTQRKKLVSESDDEISLSSQQSVIIKKKTYRKRNKKTVSDDDSQASTTRKKKNDVLKTNKTSQSLTKSKKKMVSESDEDSGNTDKISRSLTKAKKKIVSESDEDSDIADKTFQSFTKSKKKIVSESEDSDNARRLLSQSSKSSSKSSFKSQKAKHKNKMNLSDSDDDHLSKNSLLKSSGSESTVSSQRHKKRRADIESDDDSSNLEESQTIHNKKNMVTSEDSINSLSQNSTTKKSNVLKNNKSINNSQTSFKENKSVVNSDEEPSLNGSIRKNKRKHVMDSDSSDEDITRSIILNSPIKNRLTSEYSINSLSQNSTLIKKNNILDNLSPSNSLKENKSINSHDEPRVNGLKNPRKKRYIMDSDSSDEDSTRLVISESPIKKHNESSLDD